MKKKIKKIKKNLKKNYPITLIQFESINNKKII